MRKIIFLLLLVIGAVQFVHAQDDYPITGLVSINNAEVRVGPDFAYDAINQLPLNTSVIVVGRAGTFFSRWDGRQWLEIEYGGGTAWVYARLIRTSVPFNSIPPTGMMLPRNRDGRVPEEFNLATNVCDQWVGSFAQSGDFMAGDGVINLTVPPLQGANLYRVYVFPPGAVLNLSGSNWVRFESTTNVIEIQLDNLPRRAGTYTWRAAPYWSFEEGTFNAQQVCLLQTGGTFEKPEYQPSVSG